jgi:nucleotide-binding universal stress UspA family protein
MAPDGAHAGGAPDRDETEIRPMKDRNTTISDTTTTTLAAAPVIACLDRSRHADHVLTHALAIATLLGAPLRVVQALEPPTEVEIRPDPLDWTIKRLEARETLSAVVSRVAGARAASVADVSLLHGSPADEIRRDSRRRKAGLVVMGVHGEGDGGPVNGLGATTRAMIEGPSGMVLVVPDEAGAPRCRRILLPTDGSCWSETALPVAARLARAAGADVTIVQVVVMSDPAGNLPPEPEDLDLRARLVARDERVAGAHLDQLKDALTDQGVEARALTIRAEDARVALSALLARDIFDLVVMAACGHGGARLSDRACGGVAAHLAAHSPAPVLLVRHDAVHHPDGLDAPADHAPRHPPMRPVEMRAAGAAS